MRTTAIRRNLVRRYPIASFFLLALALGAGTLYLVVRGVLPAGMALASAVSASIAGMVVTAVEDGRSGLQLVLRRLLIWRAGIGYWVFAILFLVPAFLLGSVVNPIFNGDPISPGELRPAFDIVPLFIGFFIVSGLGQELGWSGFLMPRLQARFGALTSCVIRAVLVGLWHLPLFLYSRHQIPALGGFPYSGWIAQKGFPEAVATSFLMFMLPWSIFFGWMLNSTGGSLLLVAVLHASEIWAAYWMLRAGIDPSNLDNYWGYGTLLLLTAVLIVAVNGPQNLSRKHERVARPQSPPLEALREQIENLELR